MDQDQPIEPNSSCSCQFQKHGADYLCSKCGKIVGLRKLSNNENLACTFLERLASQGIKEFCAHGFSQSMTISTPFIMIHCFANSYEGDIADKQLRSDLQNLVKQIQLGEILFCKIEKLRLTYYEPSPTN